MCEQLVSLYPHKNIIELLPGSRTNGYTLAYDGFLQRFLPPRNCRVSSVGVLKFICEN